MTILGGSQDHFTDKEQRVIYHLTVKHYDRLVTELKCKPDKVSAELIYRRAEQLAIEEYTRHRR